LPLGQLVIGSVAKSERGGGQWARTNLAGHARHLLLEEFGQAKVCDLAAAVPREQNILALEVTVHDHRLLAV
jgi:hypothetical protein